MWKSQNLRFNILRIIFCLFFALKAIGLLWNKLDVILTILLGGVAISTNTSV